MSSNEDFLTAKARKRAALDRLLAIAPALEAAGVEPMSDDEINVEIEAARAERRGSAAPNSGVDVIMGTGGSRSRRVVRERARGGLTPGMALTVGIIAALLVGLSVIWHRAPPGSSADPQPSPPSRPDAAQSADPDPASDQSAEASDDRDAATPPQISQPPASARVAASKPWLTRLSESRDYYSFVRAALPPALKGDSGAQFAISEALTTCEGVTSLYAGETSPEALWSRFPRLSTATLDVLQEEYARCNGFISSNAFAELPAQQHGYGSGYWLNRAVAAGNTVAAARKAYEQIAIHSHRAGITGLERTAILAEATGLLERAAAEPGDADAYWYMGLALLAVDDDPAARDRGAALILLACDTGYDCGPRNSRNLVMRCNRFGDPECPPDAPVPYYLARDAGEPAHARAFAMAESMRRELEAGTTPVIDVSIAAPK